MSDCPRLKIHCYWIDIDLHAAFTDTVIEKVLRTLERQMPKKEMFNQMLIHWIISKMWEQAV